MQDITKPQPKNPFNGKEFAANLLIAIMPGSVLIVLLKQFVGIVGAVPTLIIILGCAWLVGRVREKKGNKATGKSILLWVLINIAFFIFVPAILLALFT